MIDKNVDRRDFLGGMFVASTVIFGVALLGDLYAGLEEYLSQKNSEDKDSKRTEKIKETQNKEQANSTKDGEKEQMWKDMVSLEIQIIKNKIKQVNNFSSAGKYDQLILFLDRLDRLISDSEQKINTEWRNKINKDLDDISQKLDNDIEKKQIDSHSA